MRSVFKLESDKLKKSLTFWGLAGTLLFLLSTIFYRLLLDYLVINNTAFTDQNQMPNVALTVIQPYFSWSALLFVFIIPLITMNTLSGEKRDNTFHLIASAPISALDYLGGKFLAYSKYLLAFLLLVLLPPVTLAFNADIDFGILFSSLIAIALLDFSFISLGIFWSSLFTAPYVAAGVTCLSAFGLLMIDWINPFGSRLTELTQSLSLLRHAYGLFQGQLILQDLGFYFIFIFVLLTLSWRIIDHKLISLH